MYAQISLSTPVWQEAFDTFPLQCQASESPENGFAGWPWVMTAFTCEVMKCPTPQIADPVLPLADFVKKGEWE